MASMPIAYTAFFLWIEPFFTLVGATYAIFMPQTYLDMTHKSAVSGTLSPPTATLVALRQLGNLYVALAINEALVLRATTDKRVWKALLLGLLIADMGHLLSLHPLGLGVYYEVQKWGPMDWGNVAFVYCGATMRTCYLLDVGTGGPTKKPKPRARKTITSAPTDTVDVAKTPVKTPKTSRAKKSKAT